MSESFRHADDSLRVIYREMAREFQNLSTQMGFDELNTMGVRGAVNGLYARLDIVVQREYRKLCRLVYRDAVAETGRPPDDFDFDAFVRKILQGYDPVSDFVYTREWTRKRDRLFESIIAGRVGNQEIRKLLKRAMDLLSNQVRQYADNITAWTRIEAFKRTGMDVVAWVTQKDEKVCAECGPRDEVVYPIELLPPYPAHWHCRCEIYPVEMEEKKRRKAKRY